MQSAYPPIIEGFHGLLHGGDYNPDQWLESPEVLQEDMRLMRLAKMTSCTLGVFAWTGYEPNEGQYRFDWLDAMMDRAAEHGLKVILATPSGSKPAWMSQAYPQIRRVNIQGLRDVHKGRHNHCPTSPIYRQKVAMINAKLAERYADHPALAVWHISNEYNGHCWCDLCLEAFRAWLRDRYGTLDRLNQSWWTSFWSHTFTDWSEIDPRDHSIEALAVDWKRFMTDQTVDFMVQEINAVRAYDTRTPVTTNFMGFYEGHDYWRFAEHVDVISNDSYPSYHHRPDDWKQGAAVSMIHDMNRRMKGGKPFMLMESSPSATNWMGRAKLKRPGVLLMESLQAVGHGADTVQYFQWRKSRGAYEKFHGAVVDHVGHEDTRVFQEVAQVGAALEKLGAVAGGVVDAEVGLIHDWHCRWSLDASCGPSNDIKDYMGTSVAHYRPFWQQGVAMDVMELQASEKDYQRYKLLVAPMLYAVSEDQIEALASYVHGGGTLVLTYLSGIVDRTNLCHLGGWPGGRLRTMAGVWVEELDSLYDGEHVRVCCEPDNTLALAGEYEARAYCDLMHAETAEVLAHYGSEFYAGRPAVTVNRYGSGRVYYIGARMSDAFLGQLTGRLIAQMQLPRGLDAVLPEGVSCSVRRSESGRFIFVINYDRREQWVDLGNRSYRDILNDQTVSGRMIMSPYGVRVLQDEESDQDA